MTRNNHVSLTTYEANQTSCGAIVEAVHCIPESPPCYCQTCTGPTGTVFGNHRVGHICCTAHPTQICAAHCVDIGTVVIIHVCKKGVPVTRLHRTSIEGAREQMPQQRQPHCGRKFLGAWTTWRQCWPIAEILASKTPGAAGN